jgi:hypothetical protein
VERSIRNRVALVFAVASAACGHGKNEQSAAGNVAIPPSTPPSAVPGTSYGVPTAGVETTTATPKHHSKLGGAAAGAAAGHMLGGHAVVGAAAGALYQHERNKHQK